MIGLEMHWHPFPFSLRLGPTKHISHPPTLHPQEAEDEKADSQSGSPPSTSNAQRRPSFDRGEEEELRRQREWQEWLRFSEEEEEMRMRGLERQRHCEALSERQASITYTVFPSVI